MNQVAVSTNSLPADWDAIEKALVKGDLIGLTPEQRVLYVNKVCNEVGLNPMTQPFSFISMQGKLIMYANKGCGEQLRSNKKISVQVVSREKIEDIYIVTARARMPDGREDESTGAVSIAGKRGEDLCNAMMKAETKAKRRVTLSISSLNLLDETEIESIPGATKLEDDKAKLVQSIIEEQPKEEPKPEPTVVQAEVMPSLADYVIPAKLSKKHGGKMLKEVDLNSLQSFLKDIEKAFEGKTMTTNWVTVYDTVKEYLTPTSFDAFQGTVITQGDLCL